MNRLFSSLFFLVFLSFGGTTAAGQEPYRIGVVGALTGPKSAYGMSHKRGAELAVSQINARGGINGRPLALLQVDDQGLMGTVGPLVTDLIFKKNVLAILGSVDSGCTHVISMICVKTQVPHFTCVATDPSLTRAGTPWTFRTLADDDKQTETIATFLQQKDVTDILILGTDSRYGKMGANLLAKRLTKLSRQVTGPIWLKPDVAEALPAIREALRHPPQAVVLWTLAEEGRQLAGFLAAERFSGFIMGGDGLASPNFFASREPGIDGVIITCPYMVQERSPANQAFVEAFTQAYGAAPDSFAAHAFDTVHFIARGIEAAGSGRVGGAGALDRASGAIGADRRSLREAITRLATHEGATGKIVLDATGNDARPVQLAVCRNGVLQSLGGTP